MKILVIDTSTSLSTLAIIENEVIRGQFDLNIPLTHNQRFIKSLKILLECTSISLSEIDVFSVIKGPGNFTGLRVGVTMAKGLAYALKKPLIGINSLDALAHNFLYTSYLICPMLDARRRQVFTAFYQAPNGKIERISNYYSIAPKKLLKGQRRKTIFAGTGAEVYKDFIIAKLKNKAIFPPLHLHRPHPQVIAQITLEAIKTKEEKNPLTLVPFYIRVSEAELNKSNHFL